MLVPPNLCIHTYIRVCMYVCKDSAAPAHARTRAHRHIYKPIQYWSSGVVDAGTDGVWIMARHIHTNYLSTINPFYTTLFRNRCANCVRVNPISLPPSSRHLHHRYTSFHRRWPGRMELSPPFLPPRRSEQSTRSTHAPILNGAGRMYRGVQILVVL